MLVLWGGGQKQEDGKIYFLPADVVYKFTPPRQSGNREGAWNKMAATGDIHPGKTRAASTVLNNLIYLFGGDKGGLNFVNIMSVTE